MGDLAASPSEPIGSGGIPIWFASIGSLADWMDITAAAGTPVGWPALIATAQVNWSANASAIGLALLPDAVMTVQNTATATLGQSSIVPATTPTDTALALAFIQALDEAIEQANLADAEDPVAQFASS